MSIRNTFFFFSKQLHFKKMLFVTLILLKKWSLTCNMGYCQQIAQYNRIETSKKRVKYYGEVGEETFEDNGVNYIFDWGIGGMEKRYFLKEQSYHCPKCKEENLQFYLIGDWYQYEKLPCTRL